MDLGEKGITYRATRRAYVGNYFIIGLVLVFFVLAYFRFNLSFTLFPRTGQEIISSLIVLAFFAGMSFMVDEPVLEGWVRHYILTNHEIIKIEGVLRKKKLIIPFGSVADVSVRKSIFGRLLNYGDVQISGFKDPIVMKAMNNPELIQKIIQNKINIYRKKPTQRAQTRTENE